MSEASSTRRLLGPFNRVEGDLEIQVEVEQGVITQAWVNSPLFRGYEQILHGKEPLDALVYTPRICGICSVSQSVAAAQAIAHAQGLSPCPNGQLATNLILAAENMADHMTHFYLFFMPDFARDVYASHDWFEQTALRFKAQKGAVAKEVLPERASFLHLTGILAGKWPHSLAIQPGGTTRSIVPSEVIRITTLLSGFRQFLQQTLFGVSLEQMGEIENQDQLFELITQYPNSDLAHFLRISQQLDLIELGRTSDQFMSYGAYTQNTGHLFQSGVWHNEYSALDSDLIREDLSQSWLKSQSEPKHPFRGSTIPDTDESSGYSWCKAPRLDSRVMEVGAISRQMVHGHPLIRSLVAKSGANVQNRVIARLLELAIVVPQMEQWARQLKPNEVFCESKAIPDEAKGAGMVEAARGSLGHWVHIKNGRIINYQIIAPTTWNFSPRDGEQQPGALEQALQGVTTGDDVANNASIQHIIRSFDPCMVCTVH